MFSPCAAPGRRHFVKICGVCNAEDAILCHHLGVDAVGMILTKPGRRREAGSDRLERAEAAKLARSLPDELKSVLLVHADSLVEILELAEEISPSMLQVQKRVDPEMLLRVKERFPEKCIINSFSVTSGVSLPEIEGEIRMYVDQGASDVVLLDSAHGGSGATHDWKISAELVKRFSDTPVILAGGLNAENVEKAFRIVRPYGVDVMSGVTGTERRDRKDPDRLHAFMKAVYKDFNQ